MCWYQPRDEVSCLRAPLLYQNPIKSENIFISLHNIIEVRSWTYIDGKYICIYITKEIRTENPLPLSDGQTIM